MNNERRYMSLSLFLSLARICIVESLAATPTSEYISYRYIILVYIYIAVASSPSSTRGFCGPSRSRR